MLVNFKFKNVRSFYEEAELSMQTTKDTSLREINTFIPEDNRLDASKCDLLKSALIFGPNASGKSNVLKAMDYMRRMVLTSSSSTGKPVAEQNEPFLFFEDAPKEESLYEVEIVKDKMFYDYGFILRENKITSEWLKTKNERTITLFKRSGRKLKIKDFNETQAKLIDIPDEVLFISVGNTFNTPIKENINDVIDWFRNLRIIFDSRENFLKIYEEKNTYLDKALDVLKKADTGVNELEYKEIKIGESTPNNIDFLMQKVVEKGTPMEAYSDDKSIYDIDLVTRYSVYDNKDNQKVTNTKDIYLLNNAGFNSEGTRRLLMYLGYIIETLDKGGVVLLDEIDSRLHFLVSDYLIKMFNSIDENPNNAQLIATAHNTMLMDDGLRRDQIYFTTKDKCGASSLISLSDFKDVRKTDLFSKKYLAGFYTKLPDFNRGV